MDVLLELDLAVILNNGTRRQAEEPKAGKGDLSAADNRRWSTPTILPVACDNKMAERNTEPPKRFFLMSNKTFSGDHYFPRHEGRERAKLLLA